VLKTRGPAIAAALDGTDAGAPSFDIDLVRKDLSTMLAEAEARGATLPLAERALAIYDAAAKEGWGNRDGAWLPAYWPSRSPAQKRP
jgi:3-hydroxyisobutyrate dehydrogenase-like beta-hydroxyacid dehydrogenase